MSFQVQVEQLDTVRRRLVVQVPAADIAGEVESAVRQLARTANVPGFRTGRVPRGVIEKRFGGRVQADVCERLMNESLVQALEQEKITPVGPPEITAEVADLQEGLRYSVTVEVKPEVIARDYRGIDVERPIKRPTEADVDAWLANLQQRRTELQPIEDREQAEAGDVVTVDLEGTMAGKPVHRREGRQIEIGAPGVLAELDAALRGAKVGAELTVDIAFPDDHEDAALAGQTGQLQVAVRGMSRKLVPELDDEFAKDVSDFATLVELRANLRQRLEDEASGRADSEARKHLLAELLRRNPELEVPRAMVERRLDALVDEIRDEWTQRRIWPANDADLVARLRTDLLDEARNRVRTALLLEAVARQEAISVSEAELDDLTEVIVGGDDAEHVEALRSFYARPEVRASMELRRLQDKVVDFLFEQANVTTVEKENDVADPRNSD